MPELFYGTWRIQRIHYALVHTLDIRLVLAGTDGLNGHHGLGGADPFDKVVAGEAWTATMIHSLDLLEWFEVPLVLRASFLDPEGLVVELDGTKVSGGLGTGMSVGLDWSVVLKCTCLDESIDFKPVPNPYDFTYPKE